VCLQPDNLKPVCWVGLV